VTPVAPSHHGGSDEPHPTRESRESRESRDSRESSTGGVTVNRLRAALVHGSLVLFALAIIAKSAQIQIVEGDKWARLAASQQVKEEQIDPPRGRIHESTGNVLVETRELMKRIGRADDAATAPR
jgi:hypothetical protein